jgi:hypothetical protein
MRAACDEFRGAGFSLRGASAPQILVAACRIVGQDGILRGVVNAAIWADFQSAAG